MRSLANMNWPAAISLELSFVPFKSGQGHERIQVMLVPIGR
jgi:hypothetical protein